MNIFKIDEAVKTALRKVYNAFPIAEVALHELDRAVECQTKLLFELYHLLDELEGERDPDVIWHKLHERVGSMLSIALDKKTPGQLYYESTNASPLPYHQLGASTKQIHEEKGKALFDAYEANKIR